MSIGIYKITSPSGKIYVGQSKNIKRRFDRYKKLQEYNLSSQPRLFNSLVKYGVCSHIFEIIEECKFEDLNIRERYWQDYYDVLGPKGLNCILTNTNELPKVFSHTTKNKISKNKKGHSMFNEEWKMKISKGNTGKIRNEEQKQKYRENRLGSIQSEYFREVMTKIHKNKIVSQETRDKISKSNKGKTITEEHKEIISQTNKGNSYTKGFKYSEESKNKISQSKSINILCIETGIIYLNTRYASKGMNISPTLINNSCNNGTKAKGYTFKKLK